MELIISFQISQQIRRKFSVLCEFHNPANKLISSFHLLFYQIMSEFQYLIGEAIIDRLMGSFRGGGRGWRGGGSWMQRGGRGWRGSRGRGSAQRGQNGGVQHGGVQHGDVRLGCVQPASVQSVGGIRDEAVPVHSVQSNACVCCGMPHEIGITCVAKKEHIKLMLKLIDAGVCVLCLMPGHKLGTCPVKQQ